MTTKPKRGKMIPCPGCKKKFRQDEHGYAICMNAQCEWHFYDDEGGGMRQIPQAEIDRALKPTRARRKKQRKGDAK